MEILNKSAYEKFAKRQLEDSIKLALIHLESAEYWGNLLGVCPEASWDLNISKLNAEAAQLSIHLKPKVKIND